MSSNSSILIRPAGVSPMLTSKKTTGRMWPAGGSGMDIFGEEQLRKRTEDAELKPEQPSKQDLEVGFAGWGRVEGSVYVTSEL